MRRMRIRLSLRLLLAVVCFCSIGLSSICSRADSSLVHDEDYKIYLKHYMGQMSFDSYWLDELTLISQNYYSTSDSSYSFSIPQSAITASGGKYKYIATNMRLKKIGTDAYYITDNTYTFTWTITSSFPIQSYLITYGAEEGAYEDVRLKEVAVNIPAGESFTFSYSWYNDINAAVGAINVYFISPYNEGITNGEIIINDLVVDDLGEGDNSDNSGGILAFLRNILSGIQNLPTKIGAIFSGIVDGAVNSISGFFDGLKEHVTDIIDSYKQFMSDMFAIPDKSYFDSFTDDLTLEMREHLGAIYQILDFIEDLFDMLMSPTIKSTLTFPEVKFQEFVIIPEQEVVIIPDGLSYLLDLVRLVTSIMLVIALFNYLRKQPYIIIGMVVDITTANEEVSK